MQRSDAAQSVNKLTERTIKQTQNEALLHNATFQFQILFKKIENKKDIKTELLGVDCRESLHFQIQSRSQIMFKK